MEKIIKNLLNWERKGKGYPTQLQFHLTNFCNLKCIFCPTRSLVPGEQLKIENELSTEKWLDVIEQAVKLRIEEFHLCGGGEPFFFLEKCLLVMKKIKEYDKYGEVITNGTFLTPKVSETLVRIGWDKIYISLDAPDARTQNFLRGSNCFHRIIKNVKSLVELKKRYRKDKPRIAFHMVICNRNYRSVPQMLELAKKVGIDEVLLNALNVWKEEIRKLQLNEKEEDELKKILVSLLKDKPEVDTNLEEFLAFEFYRSANIMDRKLKDMVRTIRGNGLSKAPCFYPWYNISIFADGVVQPCFIPQNVGENIKEKSLREIWFGEIFNRFRRNLLKGTLTDYCARCNPWNLPKMERIRRKLNKLTARF